MSRRVSIALVLLAGCMPDLQLPATADVECSGDSDCPPSMRCLEARCVDRDANLAPRLEATVPARAGGAVTIPATVHDFDDATVEVQVEYRVGDGAWIASALEQPAQTADGTPRDLGWPAGELGLDYLPQVSLRLTADDGQSHRVTSVPVELGPFAHGTTPPVLLDVEVDGEVLDGLAILTFTVSDTENDAVGVAAMQIDRSADFSDPDDVEISQGPGSAFPAGGAEDLAAPSSALQHTVVWDSHFGADLDATELHLRLKVSDAYGGISEWAPAGAGFASDNQSPPVVLAAHAALGKGENPIDVYYTLADEQSDLVDVVVEYTAQAEAGWSRCRELIVPRSEGTYRLATTPPGVDGMGGLLHTFVWDPAGATPGPVRVRLRIRATDGKNSTIGESEVAIAAPLLSRENRWAYFTLALPQIAAAVDVLLADVSGDPSTDLIIADDISGVLHVVDFAADELSTRPMPAPVDTLAVAHLDADADLDIVAGSYAGDVIASLGRTGGAVTLASGLGEVAAVGAADFDADGLAEVAVVLPDTAELQIIHLDAAGAATEVDHYANAGVLRAVAIADLDQNGIADLVVADINADVVQVYRGAAGGPLQSPQAAPTGAAPWAVTLEDLDSDGDVDAVVSTPDDRALTVLPGRGDGTFEERVLVEVGGFPEAVTVLWGAGQPREVAFVDGSADGLVSLPLAVAPPGRIDVSKAAALYLPVSGLTGRATAGDLDADGVTDVVLARLTGSPVMFLSRDQQPPAQRLDSEVALSQANQAGNLLLRDLDQDGTVDVFNADYAPTVVPSTLLLGNPPGDIVSRRRVSGPSIAGAGGVDAADFDGDGQLDLVISERSLDRVSLWMGDGAGGFTPGVTLPTAEDPVAVLATDFEGDGVADLVATSNGDGEIRLLRGNGDGTFAPPVIHDTPAGLLSVAVGDFDGDGNLDLVAPLWRDLSLAVLFGRGDGTFDELSIVPTGYGNSAVVARDFNADGLVDLASADSGSGVRVLLALGRGRSAPPFAMGAPYSLRQDLTVDLAAGDLDGDAVLDIVVLGQANDDIAVLLGNSTNGIPDGTLGEPTYFAAVQTRHLGLADLDGDGTIDLVRSNQSAQSVDARFGVRHRLARYDDLQVTTGVPAADAVEVAAVGEVEPAGLDRFGEALLAPRVRMSPQAVAPAHPVPGLRPAIHPVHVEGLLRLARVAGFGTAGPRLQVQPRFGGGNGLDLTVSPPTGLMVQVPLLSPGLAAASPIRLFFDTDDWQLAADCADDPDRMSPRLAGHLPRQRGALGEWRDRVVPRPRRLELARDPDGDLATGVGPRFIVASNPARLVVLLDRPGILHAYRNACGDGVPDANEACDDGNTTSGDGCSSECRLECTGACSGVVGVCSDPGTLCFCAEGQWQPFPCDAQCAQYGALSVGCNYDSGSSSDRCFCTDVCSEPQLVQAACDGLQYGLCTCSPMDPCSWNGDGSCDQYCIDNFPAHFDDSDCGPGCAGCANLTYTACSCSSADPCGWAGDGGCDQPCIDNFPDHFDDSADCP